MLIIKNVVIHLQLWHEEHCLQAIFVQRFLIAANGNVIFVSFTITGFSYIFVCFSSLTSNSKHACNFNPSFLKSTKLLLISIQKTLNHKNQRNQWSRLFPIHNQNPFSSFLNNHLLLFPPIQFSNNFNR